MKPTVARKAELLKILTLVVAVCMTNQSADQIQNAAKDENFHNALVTHFSALGLTDTQHTKNARHNTLTNGTHVTNLSSAAAVSNRRPFSYAWRYHIATIEKYSDIFFSVTWKLR